MWRNILWLQSQILACYKFFSDKTFVQELKVGKLSNDFVFFRYQKTESVIKPIAEKTTSIFGGIGSGLTNKLGQLKNSESFRSLEEKVGSAFENVKVGDF